LFAQSGELIADYAKQHLVPGFEARFKPGDEDVVRSIEGTRFGVAICKDMDLRSLDALTRAWASMPCWCRPMISTGMLSLHASMAVLRGVRAGSAWSGRPVTGF
jgi:apolipoprotein N-acyltransferase